MHTRGPLTKSIISLGNRKVDLVAVDHYNEEYEIDVQIDELVLGIYHLHDFLELLVQQMVVFVIGHHSILLII